MTTIYTIGFTKKSAEDFFESLRRSGARHLFDIRLRNTSQLAGFSKRDDLPYFLRHITDIEYHEVPALAPEDWFMKEYRKTKDWAIFEHRYLELIRGRRVEHELAPTLFEEGVILLCSEAEPEHCHRRLAAEYLAERLLPGADIEHL